MAFSTRDMIPEAPAGCPWKVGDMVTYTNDYGVPFGPKMVLGFTKPGDELLGGACVYVTNDAYWCPVKSESLTAYDGPLVELINGRAAVGDFLFVAGIRKVGVVKSIVPFVLNIDGEDVEVETLKLLKLRTKADPDRIALVGSSDPDAALGARVGDWVNFAGNTWIVLDVSDDGMLCQHFTKDELMVKFQPIDYWKVTKP